MGLGAARGVPACRAAAAVPVGRCIMTDPRYDPRYEPDARARLATVLTTKQFEQWWNAPNPHLHGFTPRLMWQWGRNGQRAVHDEITRITGGAS